MNMFCCAIGKSIACIGCAHCVSWPRAFDHISHLGSRTLRTLTAHIAQSEVHMHVRMFNFDFWGLSEFCIILVYAHLDSEKDRVKGENKVSPLIATLGLSSPHSYMLVSNVPRFACFLSYWKFDEICTHAFCTIFCIGACASRAICSAMAIHASLFSAGSYFRTLILDALQVFWQMHLPHSFSDSSETEKDRTYCSSRAASLVPNPSWVLNSLGTYFFRWRHPWSSNCVPVSFRLPFLWPSYWPASSHGPRCEMAGEIFRTPTAKTWHQPYVHRSAHIRCNFKPASTCPTPPNPYQLMWVKARIKKHWRRKHATMPS